MKPVVINENHSNCLILVVELNRLVDENGCTHDHSNLNKAFDVVDNYMYAGHPVDRIGTIKWLEENGGYCDCEIIMNVFTTYESEIQESYLRGVNADKEMEENIMSLLNEDYNEM